MANWGAPFAVDVEVTGNADTAVVRPSGEIDIATGPALEAEVEFLVEAGIRTCAIDLTDVEFIDSAGLQLLLAARAALRRVGGTFSIRGASPSVSRLLDISGMSALLEEPAPAS
ncbi:MAG: STAS domain-containing protein [Acidimicrobiia bacterium]